jgi:GntR family transcriptional regulator
MKAGVLSIGPRGVQVSRAESCEAANHVSGGQVVEVAVLMTDRISARLTVDNCGNMSGHVARGSRNAAVVENLSGSRLKMRTRSHLSSRSDPVTPPAARQEPKKPARVPRYRSLYEAVRGEIMSGALPVGDRLPTEDELCHRFDVSRHTVRSALRHLAEDGLIASRQGSRSVVLKPAPPGIYTSTVSSLDELLHYATDVHYEVAKSGMVIADHPLASRLGALPGQRWLRVEGTRSRAEQANPVCWTEVFVHADYAGIGLLIGRREGTIYSWIEEMYGVRIEEVRQVLSVEPMSAEVAAAVHCEAGDMAVVIRRSYYLQDETLVEVAFNQHPADRFRYELSLRKRG